VKPELKPLKQIEVTGYYGDSSMLNIFDPSALAIEHENADLTNGFALRFSGDKDNGTYVEIGSSDWIKNNHTYMLEKEFGWTGVGIEIEGHFVNNYNQYRTNPCIKADAKSFNWDKYFEDNNFPKQIDHLSIDIDSGNYLSLINMPLSRYRFTTIVIENKDIADMKQLHNNQVDIRENIKDILLRYGYTFIGSGYSDDFWIDNTYLKLAGNQYDGLSLAFWHRNITD
jgi:hypothetical protein